MADLRRHRGADPRDHVDFAEAKWPTLRMAVDHLSWLWSQGYAERSALTLVGNRFQLTRRQREALCRVACAEDALKGRARRCVDGVTGTKEVAIDGYNVLITVERALSGGLILMGRDGCYRDLASVHGTYREVIETEQAVRAIDQVLDSSGVGSARWYFDQPVSNSGRLAGMIRHWLADQRVKHEVLLVPNPDKTLGEGTCPVASADSWVLDKAPSWINLARQVIDQHVIDTWLVDLTGGGD
jgi:hypothetical protein